MARGEPGGWGQLALLTGMRSLIIAPGLAAAGIPRDDLLRSALYASVGISMFTLLMSTAKVQAERH